MACFVRNSSYLHLFAAAGISYIVDCILATGINILCISIGSKWNLQNVLNSKFSQF
jgi:hypothetical protein